MRRFVLGATSLALGLTLLAPRAEAQFFVSASATLPAGDYGEYAETGWLAGVGAKVWSSASQMMNFWVVAEYGSNSHSDDEDDKTNIMSGGGWISYALSSNPDASVTPFIVGGGGYMNHQFDDGEGNTENFGQAFAGGGVGLGFGSEGKGPWVLATYRYGFDDTTFLAVGAGWTF